VGRATSRALRSKPGAPGIREEQLQRTDGCARCLPQSPDLCPHPFTALASPLLGPAFPPSQADSGTRVARGSAEEKPLPFRSLSSPRNFVLTHPARTCRRPPASPSPEEEKRGLRPGLAPPPSSPLPGHPPLPHPQTKPAASPRPGRRTREEEGWVSYRVNAENVKKIGAQEKG